MSRIRSLVLSGMVLSSLLIAFLGYSVSAHASLPAETGETRAVKNKADPVDQVTDQNGENKPSNSKVTSKKGCQVSQKYPESIRQWCVPITKFARQNNLDPDLVAALIWQESGGNPEAFSQSGAVGLMQIMPRDGIAASFQCINGPCFSSRPSITELKDPQFNLKYGTGMLKSLVAKHGNLREALRSYGPMDVGYTYADRVMGLFADYKK
jgi:soluble lytic murein transglycosylase-like protein